MDLTEIIHHQQITGLTGPSREPLPIMLPATADIVRKGNLSMCTCECVCVFICVSNGSNPGFVCYLLWCSEEINDILP